MKPLLALAVLVSGIVCQPAVAQDNFTANALKGWYVSGPNGDFAALAYVTGVRDMAVAYRAIAQSDPMIMALPNPPKFVETTPCIPVGVTNYQLLSVVKKAIDAQPQNLHYPAVAFVVLSFLDAWPCSRP